jgi:hypothetical protein
MPAVDTRPAGAALPCIFANAFALLSGQAFDLCRVAVGRASRYDVLTN